MSKLFDAIEVRDEIRRFVDNSVDVADQVHVILERQGKTQRDLANLLGKSESEVSKWLTGTHNFTLKSISKIESALGEKVIATPVTSQQQFRMALERAVRIAETRQTFHQPRLRIAVERHFVSVTHVAHEDRVDQQTEKEKIILQVA